MKFIILLVIFAGLILVGMYARANINNKLKQCVQLKDYQTYLNILNSFFVKLLFQPFQVEEMRLNAYMALNDKKKIDEKFNLLLASRKSRRQSESIYWKAFLYYVRQKDKAMCEKLLEPIETMENETMKKQVKVMYDTYILKGSNYIDTLLTELKQADEKNRGPLEFLLSLQYKNAGNKAKALEYEKLSKSHMLASIE